MKIPNVTIQQLLELVFILAIKLWDGTQDEEIYFWQKETYSYNWFNSNIRTNKNSFRESDGTVANNGKTLFVSTKKQASEAIADVAKETEQFMQIIDAWNAN